MLKVLARIIGFVCVMIIFIVIIRAYIISPEASNLLSVVSIVVTAIGILVTIDSSSGSSKVRKVNNTFQTSIDNTIRGIYLDWLQQDTEERLEVSIHKARFIDLNMTEKLSATRPWTYKSYFPNTPAQEFSNFDEAFKHYHKRILVMGNPGGGKTTTLLDITRDLVQEAKNDIDMPIPILINVSTWRTDNRISGRRYFSIKNLPFRLPQNVHQYPFTEWLENVVSELHKPRGLNKLIQSCLNDGHVTLLLDGLDEIQQNDRISFIQSLNEYIAQYPHMIVVVTCRSTDYEPLQQNQETRLALEGAVTLQLLTREQINTYLTEAHAVTLRDAFINDPALYDLAEVPLTLSMMVLAYGNSRPMPNTNDLTLEDRRRNLFDFYVDRMIQRKTRRDLSNPNLHTESLNPEEDRKPFYTRQQIDRYLGWLAVRLAEKPQNTFRRYDVYYIKKQVQHYIGINSLVSFIVMIAIISIISLIVSFHAIGFAQNFVQYLSDIGIAICITGSVYWSLRLIDIRRERLEKKVSFFGCLSDCLALLSSLFIFFMLPFGLSLSITIASAQKISLSVYIALFDTSFEGVSIVAIIIFTYFLLKGDKTVLQSARDVLRNYISENQFDALRPLTKLFTLLIGVIIMGLFLGAGIGIGTLLIEIFTAPLLLIASYTSGAILVGVFLGIINSGTERLTGGAYVIIAFICALLCAPLGLPWNVVSSLGLTLFIASKFGSILNSYIIEPTTGIMTRSILTLNQVWPFHDQKFLNYITNALILNKSGQGYEFVHRLLRDHFVQIELEVNQTRNPIWRGQVFFEIGNYKDALPEFDRAIRLAPQNKMLISHRGSAYLFLGLMENALWDISRVIPPSTDKQDSAVDIQLILDRAWIYNHLQRYKEASDDIERVIRSAPTNQTALNMRESVKKFVD